MSPANAPPMKKKNVIEIRYSIAMRLWSPVSSQLSRPSSAVMKFFFGTRAVLWSGKRRIVLSCCAHGFTTPDAGGAAWSDSDVVSVCCTR